MKARELPRVVPPKPVELPSCAACKAFRPEVVTLQGECCWYCAHAIVEHEATLKTAPEHECECMPHEIYPPGTVQTIV